MNFPHSKVAGVHKGSFMAVQRVQQVPAGIIVGGYFTLSVFLCIGALGYSYAYMKYL